jgi:putative sigma-54 modulation protein
MDIHFEYDEVRASERLEQLAIQRLNKIADKNDFIIRAEVQFKKENTSSPETGMICSIQLSVPGPRLFAQATHGNFEASLAEAADDLERQLQKRKDKIKNRA